MACLPYMIPSSFFFFISYLSSAVDDDAACWFFFFSVGMGVFGSPFIPFGNFFILSSFTFFLIHSVIVDRRMAYMPMPPVMLSLAFLTLFSPNQMVSFLSLLSFHFSFFIWCRTFQVVLHAWLEGNVVVQLDLSRLLLASLTMRSTQQDPQTAQTHASE